MNSNLSDIGTALTQSLATTGVTPMTGPILAAAGAVGAPSYAFSGALTTGFYLAGANQIGIATAGLLAATINANQTTSWIGAAAFAAALTIGTTLGVTGAVTIGGTLVVTGNFTGNGTGTQTIGGSGAIINFGAGAVVISTSSVSISGWIDLTKQAGDLATAPANKLRLYVKAETVTTSPKPYVNDETGYVYPLIANLGQCRLTKSGANLLLSPYYGNRILLNGVPQIIPDAGVTLAASNTAATFVYIYAFMSAGVMTLEMSTTAPAAQSGTGMRQKTGAADRTLVGAAYTDVGGAWADTDGKLWVLSYFNRKLKSSLTQIIASLSSSNAVYTEVDSGMRNQFINWLDEVVQIDTNIYLRNTSGSAPQYYSQINIDGTTTIGATIMGNVSATNTTYGITNHGRVQAGAITEAALHYASAFVRANATFSYVCSLGASAGEATSIYVTVQG